MLDYNIYFFVSIDTVFPNFCRWFQLGPTWATSCCAIVLDMENTEQSPAMQSAQKHYLFRVTSVSKILALILFIVLPFVGFWIGLKSRLLSTSAPVLIEAMPNTTEVVSAIGTEGVATTTATGYIVSTDANRVTVDYVDVLYGAEAVARAKEDGYGDATGNSVPLYDRNINPQLRTFAVAPNVTIFTDRGVKLTFEEFSKSNYFASQTQGRYYGALFEIVLNDKNEVVSIKGIFRP